MFFESFFYVEPFVTLITSKSILTSVYEKMILSFLLASELFEQYAHWYLILGGLSRGQIRGNPVEDFSTRIN